MLWIIDWTSGADDGELFVRALRVACAGFKRFGFAHVFAGFSAAVKAGAFFMIDMRLGINPDLAIAAAGRLSRHGGRSMFG